MKKDTHGNEKNVAKKKKVFTFTMKKKLAVLFASIVLALSALSVVFLKLNITSGDIYSKIVLSNLDYSSTTIAYKRGDIVDTNGTVLATSEKVYNVIVDPKVILATNGALDPTVAAIVQCFSEDETKIRELISQNASSSYIRYLRQIDYETMKTFKTYQEENSDVTGVWFETEYLRNYPYSSLACDLIGFTSSGNVGNWGIEQYYNEELNGIDGRQYGYYTENQYAERTIKAAEDGNTIVSTIDMNIQSIVEKHIVSFNEEYGSTNTGIIVADPNNGEILAMASYPVYDLNNPFDTSSIFTDEEVAATSEDAIIEALNGLWKNYCITDSYEPGSTAKPFTVAAGLEEGKFSETNTFDCSGAYTVSGITIKCHNHAGHGTQTIAESIMNSCNSALMQMAEMIGIDTFAKYQSVFGLGQKTGIDLPGESTGILYSADKMGSVDLAANSFGQGYTVTMTQMVAGFSSLVNGGYYYEPHVVRQILNSDGGVVENIDKTLVRMTVSQSTSDYIKESLLMTVEDGTGKTAQVEGYSIGGKTGTAEKLPRGNNKYVVSFIGCVPAQNPEVVIYVVIDEPQKSVSDSSLASGLAGDILADILPYMNIFKDGDEVQISEEDKTEAIEGSLLTEDVQLPEETTQAE